MYLNVTANTFDLYNNCNDAKECIIFHKKDYVSKEKNTMKCNGKNCSTNNLFPLTLLDLIGTVGVFFAIMISSGAGIGGGGLIVPIFILILKLSSHDAIPLSKATIFGGAIANIIINARRYHPVIKNRPLIDYETILLMEPMTLAGTIIGVNLNAMLPEWLITIFLVLLLSYTSFRTFKKAIKEHNIEIKAQQMSLKEIINYWTIYSRFKGNKKNIKTFMYFQKWKKFHFLPIEKHIIKYNKVESIQEKDDVENSLTEENSLVGYHVKRSNSSGKIINLVDIAIYRNNIPWTGLILLGFTWFVLLFFSLIKGGHGVSSIIGIKCGSILYYLLLMMIFPFFVCITLYFRFTIVKKHKTMERLGYVYHSGEMHWTNRNAIIYPVLCTLAGAFAGLLGIGGGMIKGPLMLHMGILPQVSTATSSTMILFTSSATTLQYLILGMLPIDFSIWYCIIGFFASYIGQILLFRLVKKYNKSSIVIFMISIVVGISGIIMAISGIHYMFKNGIGHFRSFCL